MPVGRRSLAVALATLSLVDAYLLALLAAAATARREPPPESGALRFVVLVPAHDEERTLGPTLASLAALDYPGELYEVVVVADNCTDATADVALDAGATVLERHDEERRGKGHALAWALERIDPHAEAVAIVDADCTVSPNLLRALSARLRDADAVQVRNVAGEPREAGAAALRAAALLLVNDVRPRGKTALGLSAGLLGTGMAFRRDLLERVPWRSFSLLEDGEQHLRIVAAGGRVSFAPEAEVRSELPPGLREARDQQLRWEGGRVALVRAWTPRLLRDGLCRRDAVRVHAALEPLLPPQSLLLAGHLAAALLALPSRRLRGVAAADLAAQAAFVLGGLAVADAPPSVYRSLVSTPRLVASKLGVYGSLARRGAPREWVRTTRF